MQRRSLVIWSTLVDLLSAQARLRPTLARSFSGSLGPSGDRGRFSIFRVPEFTRNPFCSGALHGNAALRPQLSSSFCRGCVAGRRGDERATRSPAPPNAISSAWKQRMLGSAECALIGGVLTSARVHQLACSAYVKKVPKGPASFTRGVPRVPLLLLGRSQGSLFFFLGGPKGPEGYLP